MSDNRQPAEERRSDGALREIFTEAYDLLEPFFDPANEWAGQSHEHLAFRALHERFPALQPQQVLILVTAAKRVFTAGRAPAP